MNFVITSSFFRLKHTSNEWIHDTDDVLQRLWNDSADEEDIFGYEFDGKSDEDYRDKSGPHRGE